MRLPGGSTGRCTPFCPPACSQWRRSVIVFKGLIDSADLAPTGRALPTCDTTTPISPARTCTQGYLSTA